MTYVTCPRCREQVPFSGTGEKDRFYLMVCNRGHRFTFHDKDGIAF